MSSRTRLARIKSLVRARMFEAVRKETVKISDGGLSAELFVRRDSPRSNVARSTRSISEGRRAARSWAVSVRACFGVKHPRLDAVPGDGPAL